MTKKTSKYDKILNTFIQLLIEGGYQSATISKIAERAEVNPSTIFRNFTDKKGLLSAVVDRHLKDLSTIFDGVSMTGNTEDDLVILSKTYQEFQVDHQEIVLIGFQAALEMPEINKAVEEIPVLFKKILGDYFSDMKKQHKIRETIDVEAATMNLLWLNFGYFLSVIRFDHPNISTSATDFYDKQIRFFAKSLV